MTPLAHRIAKELTLPKHERTFEDNAGVLRRLDEIHCFECSSIRRLAIELSRSYEQHGLVQSTLAFLPAPKTWLEWVEDDGERVAVLLTAVDSSNIAAADFILDGRSYKGAFLRLESAASPSACLIADTTTHPQAFSTGKTLALLVYAFLAMINTPRIIGRRQHMPHAGLQRAIARARGMVGKFPLRAWTEIKLEVTPPAVDEGGPHEARLTGHKALHFCRAHLRIRRGQLEMVRAHWRGDPALGIKRSRYTLVPPKAA